MLEVINLSVNYGKNIALDNVNFIINKGTITSVIGKNGSGKSTLIHSIAGFVKYSGNILYNNSEIMSIPYTMRAKEISLLPQKLTDVGYTVYELVSMGRNPYVGIGKRFQEIDYIRINNAITAMGIDGLKNKPVNQLSGGERQKAYIAMILAQDTELVILDEPTSFMDIEYSNMFSLILSDLKNKYNKTVLTVYHDINSVIDFSDYILVLDEGKTAYYGPTEECVKSGIIEKTFNVSRIDYTKNGISAMFYK